MTTIVALAMLSIPSAGERIQPQVYEAHMAPWNIAVQGVIRQFVDAHRAAGIASEHIFRAISIRINFEAEELDIRISTEERPHDYAPLSPVFIREWFP